MKNNLLTTLQVYSLSSELKSNRFFAKDKKEVNAVREAGSGKISVGEFYYGTHYCRGFSIEKENWTMLKQTFVDIGYTVKEKRKVNKKNIIGNIFWGAVLVSSIASFAYFIDAKDKIEKLKERAYEIADTNHNQTLEYKEWCQLGKELELIAKGEKLYIEEIKRRIDNPWNIIKNIGRIERYIEDNK
jgi:hypothetical protein